MDRGTSRAPPQCPWLDVVAKPFVGDALVGGVHVHQHQALAVFRQYVDALQLGQGVAQGGICSGADSSGAAEAMKSL